MTTSQRHDGYYGAGRSSSGIVLILAMFAIILLAAILCYVMNLGRHANARIVTQDSADAAAIGGAGWVARSFNTVAMNNVATTRYLAAINVLDAMPLATRSAHPEQRFLHDQLDDQLRRGLDFSGGHRAMRAIVEHQFQLLRDELREEVDLLQPVDEYFQNHDIRSVTFYKGPAGRGRLWVAMKALEEFSQTVLENMGFLAQLAAVRSGGANLEADGARGALAAIIPPMPRIDYMYQDHDDPAKQTQFDDFKRPVKWGLLPRWADHEVVNRGPYDSVFGWRRVIQRQVGIIGGSGEPPPPVVNDIDSGGRDAPFGGPSAGTLGGGGPTAIMAPDSYITYGTQYWAIDVIRRFCYRDRRRPFRRPNLRLSRLAAWVKQLATTKINYLWPEPSERGKTEFAIPTWRSRYPRQVPIPITRFSETAYFRLNIKSRYPRDHPRFMTTGSWWYNGVKRGTDRDQLQSVVSRVIRSKWWLPVNNADRRFYLVNPRQLESQYAGSKVTKLGRRAWIYEFEYQVYYDPDIGLEPIFVHADPDDPDSPLVPIMQSAYFFQVLIYAGINTNPVPAGWFNPSALRRRLRSRPHVIRAIDDDDLTPQIRNPYKGFDRESPDPQDHIPAPVDLDHRFFDKRPGGSVEAPYLRAQIKAYERQYLTFLAIARRSGEALLWPGKFDAAKPHDYMYALTQAHVFNNHSWDLWTQMWHAQISEVDNGRSDQSPSLDHWLRVYQDTLDDGLLVEDLVPPEQMDQVMAHLSSLQPLAPLLLTH